MSLTSIIRPFFVRRTNRFERYATQAEEVQRQVLARLVGRAENTLWGKEHHYADISNYEQFAEKVPISTYEELKGYIDRMRHGESDILWPELIYGRDFVSSTGTETIKREESPFSFTLMKMRS